MTENPTTSKCCEPVKGDQPGAAGRRRPGFLPSLFWSLAFIILGCLLYAQSQGLLAADKWFPYFLVAMGIVFLAEVLILVLRPERAYFSFSRLAIGAILIFIGVSLLVNFAQWLPLVLILVGIGIAAGFFTRRNHSAYK